MKYKIQVSYSEKGSFGDYPYIILDSKEEAEKTVSRLKLHCQKHEQRFRYAPIDSEEAEQFALHLFQWYNKLS